MTLEFGLTDDHFNSKYAPLAALAVAYQQRQVLGPLKKSRVYDEKARNRSQ